MGSWVRRYLPAALVPEALGGVSRAPARAQEGPLAPVTAVGRPRCHPISDFLSAPPASPGVGGKPAAPPECPGPMPAPPAQVPQDRAVMSANSLGWPRTPCPGMPPAVPPSGVYQLRWRFAGRLTERGKSSRPREEPFRSARLANPEGILEQRNEEGYRLSDSSRRVRQPPPRQPTSGPSRRRSSAASSERRTASISPLCSCPASTSKEMGSPRSTIGERPMHGTCGTSS